MVIFFINVLNDPIKLFFMKLNISSYIIFSAKFHEYLKIIYSIIKKLKVLPKYFPYNFGHDLEFLDFPVSTTFL